MPSTLSLSAARRHREVLTAFAHDGLAKITSVPACDQAEVASKLTFALRQANSLTDTRLRGKDRAFRCRAACMGIRAARRIAAGVI